MTSTRVERGPLRTRLLEWSVAYAPAAALAVLLPKCPLCIAAQLAVIGVVVPLPSYARWLAIALSAVIATAFLLVREKTRATRRSARSCCALRTKSR